jgi:hypothetical protein
MKLYLKYLLNFIYNEMPYSVLRMALSFVFVINEQEQKESKLERKRFEFCLHKIFFQ